MSCAGDALGAVEGVVSDEGVVERAAAESSCPHSSHTMIGAPSLQNYESGYEASYETNASNGITRLVIRLIFAAAS